MAVVVKEKKEKKRERNKDTKDKKSRNALQERQCLVTTLCTTRYSTHNPRSEFG